MFSISPSATPEQHLPPVSSRVLLEQTGQLRSSAALALLRTLDGGAPDALPSLQQSFLCGLLSWIEGSQQPEELMVLARDGRLIGRLTAARGRVCFGVQIGDRLYEGPGTLASRRQGQAHGSFHERLLGAVHVAMVKYGEDDGLRLLTARALVEMAASMARQRFALCGGPAHPDRLFGIGFSAQSLWGALGAVPGQRRQTRVRRFMREAAPLTERTMAFRFSAQMGYSGLPVEWSSACDLPIDLEQRRAILASIQGFGASAWVPGYSLLVEAGRTWLVATGEGFVGMLAIAPGYIEAACALAEEHLPLRSAFVSSAPLMHH